MTIFSPQILARTFKRPAGWSGPSSGLTHRWPMDDANVSGTTITDVVGSLNGTASGGVSSASGPVTQARGFDGTGYLTLASCPVSYAAAHTVGLWAYINDNTAAGNPRFFDIAVDANNGSALINDSGLSGQIAIKLLAGGSDVSQEAAAAELPSATWKHIVYTFDGSSTVTIYVNGVSITLGGGAPSGFGLDNNNIIGARNNTPTAPLTGRIYQMVTYNRALSAGEVTTLYNAN